MRNLLMLVVLLVGCRGPSGDVGPQGSSGPTGAPGPMIIQPPDVTWVQFCPGVTTQYPNTFPEGGFCMNNNIYAVYSANDGFMTMIPPGTYNSNAVGSACTFTVLANCQIQ